MGDGAMCHYCRKYKCECGDEKEPMTTAFAAAILLDLARPESWTAQAAKRALSAGAEALADQARLIKLEDLIATTPGGLLIHHQDSRVAWGGCGLGLSHRRTLRDAIDQLPEPKGSQ